MRFRFLFLGKTRVEYLDRGFKDYLGRIQAYYPAEEVVLKAARVTDGQEEAIRDEDTRRLLAAIRPDEAFIHLDPRGRPLTSEDLAHWMKGRIEGGSKGIAIGLGGPVGLSDAAGRRADLRLQLSTLTLPHELCRLIVAEQIYRGLRILAGHPYHR
jgi:23S rRNA (pseudouridine1915-N3)-methyltransferase